MYPSVSNCLHRPLGDGSFVLSRQGVLRDFPAQMRCYLDPERTFPTFSEVTEMLLSLWAEQHHDMADAFRTDLVSDWRNPELDINVEFASMNQRAREIRSWISSGCPESQEPTTLACQAEKKSVVLPGLSIDRRSGSQTWPDAWKEPNLRWRDRVWYLARHGLPEPDTLNCALLDLAQWLLGVELYDTEDREGKVHRLLRLFCAERHNDQSDHLRGVRDVACLPGVILKEIDSASANASLVREKETFVRMRSRLYRTPLRVKHLLAGEGEPNFYVPRDGIFSNHNNNTPVSPLSVAVWAAPIQGKDSGEKSLEAMLEMGVLDLPLPEEFEDRMTMRGKVLAFNRRLGNYLFLRGGHVRVHHRKLAMFADVDERDRKALSRYKEAGIRARLFIETDGYIVGEKSKEYGLTPEAMSSMNATGL